MVWNSSNIYNFYLGMEYKIGRVRSERVHTNFSPHISPYYSTKDRLDEENIFTSKQIMESLQQLIHQTKSKRKLYEQVESKRKKASSIITNPTEMEYSTTEAQRFSRKGQDVSPWQRKSVMQSRSYSFQPIVQSLKRKSANNQKFSNGTFTHLSMETRSPQYFPQSPYQAISVKSPFDLDIHACHLKTTPQTTCRTNFKTEGNQLFYTNRPTDIVPRTLYDDCLKQRRTLQLRCRSLQKQIETLKYEKIRSNMQKDRLQKIQNQKNQEILEQIKRKELNSKLLQQQIVWYLKEEFDHYRDQTKRQCAEFIKGYKRLHQEYF